MPARRAGEVVAMACARSPATRSNTVREWGTLARGLSPAIELEATGGITLENVAVYAEAGVDYVSIGALTHSVVAADLSLEVVGA